MSTKYIASNWRLPNEENSGKSDNYGLSFDGTELINLGSSEILFDSTKAFSCSVWCKVDSYSSPLYPALFSFKTDQSTGFIMFLSHTGPYKGINFGSDNNFLRRLAGNQSDIPLNTWLHIVLTYDGVNRTSASSYKVYLNGTEKTQVNSDPFAACPNENNIGGGNGTNTRFNGYISEVAVFDYALSEPQISTLYGSSSLGAGNPMAIKRQPVGYWPLGDNSASNPLTQPNEAVENASVFDFDGSSFINFGTGLGNLLGDSYAGDLTFSTWIKLPPSSNNQKGIFCIDNTNQPEFGLVNFTNAIWLYTSGNGTNIARFSTSIEDNNWHHLVLVYDADDASNTQLYIDNTPASKTVVNSQPASLNFNGDNTVLGTYYNTAGTFDLTGQLSNGQIWNTALSSTEIETLYNSGVPLTGTQPQASSLKAWYKLDQSANWDVSGSGYWDIPDASGNGNDGTSSGMTSANLVLSDLTRAVPYDSYSFNFDAASSDYIDCGDSDTFSFGNGTNDEAFSVSAWIKMDIITNFVVLSKYGASASLREYAIGFSPDKIYILLYDDNGAFRGRYYNTSTTSNDWLHIATTYNGVGGTNAQDGIKIYINGTRVDDSTYSSGSYTAMSNTTSELRIGSYSTTYADGKISNLSIFNEELTSTEVLKLYSNGVPQDLATFTPAPVAWWTLGSNSFWNGSQWTVRDMIGSNDGTGVNLGQDALVGDSPRSTAGGTGTNMDVPTNLEGSTKWSSNNSWSINMSSTARVEDTP